jgi:hypothetical protein
VPPSATGVLFEGTRERAGAGISGRLSMHNLLQDSVLVWKSTFIFKFSCTVNYTILLENEMAHPPSGIDF